ncbi:MAG TPA: hypothetical protein VF553_22065 [Pyrinomonadaceae bacterium]|jgi:hypothetical protein
MISGLKQPDSGEAPLFRTPHDLIHQTLADCAVLHVRLNRDRAYAGDGRPLPEEVAAHNSPVGFGHDRVDVIAG